MTILPFLLRALRVLKWSHLFVEWMLGHYWSLPFYWEGKLMLALASRVSLCFDPIRTPDHTSVSSKAFTWGHLFDDRRGKTTIGHSLQLGVTSAGVH
jgi:hypothetical protein